MAQPLHRTKRKAPPIVDRRRFPMLLLDDDQAKLTFTER